MEGWTFPETLRAYPETLESQPKDRVYYATDFGCVPDGKTLNTGAIQKAIDTVAKAGGGTLRFGRGTFLTGTLFLKSGVTLYWDHDATILGSPRRQDYILVDTFK